MICQACLMVQKIKCVCTSTTVIKKDGAPHLRQAYFCPQCRARYITEEKLLDESEIRGL